MERVKLGAETLLYPTPAVLVGVNVADKPNFMTAAWCGVASSSPPAISVGIRRARYTYEGIEANGTFSINVPSTDQVKVVDYCGIYSGHKRDKSEIFTVTYGSLKTAPLIEECPVNLECRVIESVDLKSHILVIGEIVEATVKADCMTDGKPDAVKIDPLVFAPGTGEYLSLGRVVATAFRIGKDKKEEGA